MALATVTMNFFHPSRCVAGVAENEAAVGMSMKGAYVGSGYGRGSDQESGITMHYKVLLSKPSRLTDQCGLKVGNQRLE